MADIIVEVVLGLLFLIFSNTDVQFIENKLTGRSYTIVKALLITKRVELITKKKFAKVALDKNSETFVVHVASLNLVPRIYPDREAQIASLLIEEVKILNKYADFANVFLEEKGLVLAEHTKLNKYAIDPEDGKQPRYGPIYSLGPVELESPKTYIETHLNTGFI